MVARVVLTATFLLVSAHPATGTTRCKAKMLRGRIVVTANEVTGTPRWGTRYGAETSVFEDTASCAVAGRLRNCPLAPAGDSDDTTPPAGCTIYVADDGPERCGAWIKSCVPSSEPPPCPILPADDIWNRDVSTLPVHPMSDTWIASIGAASPLHPDFGSGLYRGSVLGMPYVVIEPAQPKVPIEFLYSDESDPGPYPIPPLVPVEGGGKRPSKGKGDAHVLLIEAGTCKLWEVFAARAVRKGTSWDAGSGAVFDLTSSALRPDGWTSADAAGLPILPGLIRYDEILAGEITHAVRFTAPRTQRAYVWPARHFASSSTDPALPPMGIRVRLKASFDTSGFSPTNQIILEGLKRYGMMLADNGSPFFLVGAPDRRWDNDDLHDLRQVAGSDFEVVDVSSLMVDPDSGQTAPAMGTRGAAGW